jgi:DNA polymerase III alpha subunit
MKYDEYGNVIYQVHDIFSLLYKNIMDIDGITVEHGKEIEQFLDNTSYTFNEYVKPTISVEEFDRKNQKNWYYPSEYDNFNIYQYCVDNCSTDEQLHRCGEELELYEKLNMISMLTMLKYIVDTLRNNKIIWGVGRGSSVSSYVLYLLGVHRIDSLKYQLDYREFLRIGEKNG